jgi:hypothetical protein
MNATMVPIMENQLLDSLCVKVSNLLSAHPDTMLQFTPEEIKSYVVSGMGIILTHPNDSKEVAAFAKLFTWGSNNSKGRTVYELGSWIVPCQYQGNGYGEQVLMELIKISKSIDPKSQVIGVVEKSNKKSEHILKKCGGVELHPDEWPSNFQVLLQGGRAEVAVIDITDMPF